MGIGLIISLLVTAIILLIAEQHCNSFWFNEIEPYFPYKFLLSIVTILVGLKAIHWYLSKRIQKNCAKEENLFQEGNSSSLPRPTLPEIVSSLSEGGSITLSHSSPAIASQTSGIAAPRSMPEGASSVSKGSSATLSHSSSEIISQIGGVAASRLMQGTVDELISKAHHKKKQEIRLKDSLEYAMLHSEIAHRTDIAMANMEKEQWETILRDLHRNVEIRYPSGSSFLLDCSLELRRLDGQTIELEVAELVFFDILHNRKYIDSILDIILEAFDVKAVQAFNYLYKLLPKDTKLYIERNKHNPDEIFGGLFAAINSDETLDVRFFCRKASAMKIPATETIGNFLRTNSDYQRCLSKVSCDSLINYKSPNGLSIRPIYSRPIPEILDELIAKAPLKKKQDVRFKDSFEYAMLHHAIGVGTDSAIANNKKEQWQTVLENLHDRVCIHFPSGFKFQLDCSLEMSRLRGEKIELEIVELTQGDLIANKKWYASICQIFNEAFDNENPLLIGLLNDSREKFYIGRNKHNPDEIFGGLCLRKEREGVYFAHNLCKKASASKIRLTETIYNSFRINPIYQLPPNSIIRVEVLTHNTIAINIYQKLGFTLQSTQTQNEENFHVMVFHL